MVCLLCGLWGRNLIGNRSAPSGVCDSCRHSLRSAPEVRLASGIMVRAAFAHQGAVRTAIHALKYQGVDRVLQILAPAVVDVLPVSARAIIPVPRAGLRRVRYGIDPGLRLAQEIAAITGMPMIRALRARSRVGSQVQRRHRRQPSFHQIRPVPDNAVLIDDVVTTGSTLAAAAAACSPTIRSAATISRSVQASSRS